MNLDSDDEDIPKSKGTLADSFDEINYEMSVKIRWMGEVEKFTLKKFEPFKVLMEKLAERENATLSQVNLLNDEQIIRSDDTPDSIGYRISMILSKFATVR